RKASTSRPLRQTTMTQVFDKLEKSAPCVQQSQLASPLLVIKKCALTATNNEQQQPQQSIIMLSDETSRSTNDSPLVISSPEQPAAPSLLEQQQPASEQMDIDGNQNMPILNHVMENSYFTFDKSLIPLSLESNQHVEERDGFKENRNQISSIKSDSDDKTITHKIPSRSLDENGTTTIPENVRNQSTATSNPKNDHDGDGDDLLHICKSCWDYRICLPDQLKNNFQCKHRQQSAIITPQHFWSLGVPNTQTCLERGYGGVRSPTVPIERLRRPRRQLQQQSNNALNNNTLIDDEDDSSFN
ncbi:unnamed protein product, partial [Didymodactylos carnosus]